MRFYLPSTSAAAPVSPAKDAGWEAEASSGFARLVMSPTKSNSAMATQSHLDNDATDQDICFRTYCYGPLAAQAINAQAVRWTIRAQEAAAGRNLFLAWVLKVVSSDGSTLRGTVLGLTVDNTEINDAALESRTSGGTSTLVNALAGDYLIAEFGVSGDPAIGQDHDSDLRWGDPTGGADLDQSDIDTGDDAPWLDFAEDIVLESNPGGRNSYVSSVSNAFAAVRSI